MLKKSLVSLLLPVLVASCATGVNINTPNTNVDKAQISSKLMSTIQNRIKVYSGKDVGNLFKVTKYDKSGMKIKANAFEPDIEIQGDYDANGNSRNDAQCVKVASLGGDGSQIIAIFNTQYDTYSAGDAEAYAVIYNVKDDKIMHVIETSGMEFSDIHATGDGKEAQIFMVGDDSSQDLDTAFIAKWTYDYSSAPVLKINADTDLTNDDVLYLEGQNATSITTLTEKLLGVTTGENGYFYVLNPKAPGFDIKNKISDAKDARDYRTATYDPKTREIYMLDGGWDKTSASGSTNANIAPKVIVLKSDYSRSTEFNLPFSSNTTGLGEKFDFTSVAGMEKPGGQFSRAKIVSLNGEYLIIAAGTGGILSVRKDGGAGTEHNMTSLVPKGPIPFYSDNGTTMPAIINDVYLLSGDDKSANIAVSSGYHGITTIRSLPNAQSSSKIMDYRIFENPTGSTNGTSTNSFNVIDSIDGSGTPVKFYAVGNGKRGASLYNSTKF